MRSVLAALAGALSGWCAWRLTGGHAVNVVGGVLLFVGVAGVFLLNASGPAREKVRVLLWPVLPFVALEAAVLFDVVPGAACHRALAWSGLSPTGGWVSLNCLTLFFVLPSLWGPAAAAWLLAQRAARDTVGASDDEAP